MDALNCLYIQLKTLYIKAIFFMFIRENKG